MCLTFAGALMSNEWFAVIVGLLGAFGKRVRVRVRVRLRPG